MGERDNIYERLSDYAQSEFECGEHSIHGLAHWQHVDDSARLICRDTDADLMVVRFFRSYMIRVA